MSKESTLIDLATKRWDTLPDGSTVESGPAVFTAFEKPEGPGVGVIIRYETITTSPDGKVKRQGFEIMKRYQNGEGGKQIPFTLHPTGVWQMDDFNDGIDPVVQAAAAQHQKVLDNYPANPVFVRENNPTVDTNPNPQPFLPDGRPMTEFSVPSTSSPIAQSPKQEPPQSPPSPASTPKGKK